jgi:hypothetical protein
MSAGAAFALGVVVGVVFSAALVIVLLLVGFGRHGRIR